MLPSLSHITKAAEGLFVVEDLHNFGADYDKTLMAWYQKIRDNWARLKPKYGNRFYRMWTYVGYCSQRYCYNVRTGICRK